MQILRAVTVVGLVVSAFACKGGSGSGGVAATEYKHESPKFKVSIPSDLKPRNIKPDGDGGTRAFTNADGSRDILLVWAKSGSAYDPENQWSGYGKEPDHVKTIAEGQLPGGVGKWIEHDRGRIYVHAVMAKDGWGVLCMTSTPTAKPAADILAACKTLTSY